MTIPLDGYLVLKLPEGLILCTDGLEEGREDGWYEDGVADLDEVVLVGFTDGNFDGYFESC